MRRPYFAAALTVAVVVVIPGSASGGDVKCSGFASQAGAQKYFLSHAPKQDPYGLDGDGDGLACEGRPAPYRGWLTVRYSEDPVRFFGVIKSVKNQCVAEREIAVISVEEGWFTVVFSSLRGPGAGFYEVDWAPGETPGTHVYARSRPSGPCAADVSRPFTIPSP